MTALRASWLTWKMHRLEILVAAAILAMTSISAVVAASQLRDATPCVVGSFADDAGACSQRDETQTRYFAADDQANLVLGILAVVPALAGLAFGVPVVARELELRTAQTAWSWAGGRRARWLVARGAPMAAALLVAAWLASMAAADLASARAAAFGQGPSLDTMGNQGLPMVGRAFMAFGVGLLVGAIGGRTVPAILVGGLVMVLWFGWGAPTVRATQFEGHYVWTTYRERDQLRLGGLAYDRDQGEAYRAPDGTYVSWSTWVTDACGPIPDEAMRAMERYQDPTTYELDPAIARCIDEHPVPDTYEQAVRLVPGSAFGDLERTETLVTVGLGGLAILLAFPVVARR